MKGKKRAILMHAAQSQGVSDTTERILFIGSFRIRVMLSIINTCFAYLISIISTWRYTTYSKPSHPQISIAPAELVLGIVFTCSDSPYTNCRKTERSASVSSSFTLSCKIQVCSSVVQRLGYLAFIIPELNPGRAETARVRLPAGESFCYFFLL